MMSILGDRLRQARKAKGFTQDYVANIIGITYQTISNYERETRDPDTDTLAMIADLYEVSVGWLVGQTNDPILSKKNNPPPLEYVLSAPTLGDAGGRIHELYEAHLIDKETALSLHEKAYEKHGLSPAKGSNKAAHVEKNIPATGVFEDGDDNEDRRRILK